jgi:hypothetical protein
MGRLVDYNEIGDVVAKSLGLEGRDGQLCRRLVRAYVYRLGYCCQYGVRYEGDGILLMPYVSSIKRRLMKDEYWKWVFDRMKYRYWRGVDVMFYFRMMYSGFRNSSNAYNKKSKNKKRESYGKLKD